MTDQPFNAAHKTLSRRTMLKTAAWSAPVIAVAIAAPAAAASVPPATSAMKIKFNNFTQDGGQPKGNTMVEFPYFDYQSTIYLQSVTVIISGPSANYGSSASVVGGANWAFVSSAVAGTERQFTFRYTKPTQPSLTQSQSTTKLDYSLSLLGTTVGALTAKAYALDSAGKYTAVVTP